MHCRVECEGLAFHELGKIGYKYALGGQLFYDEDYEYYVCDIDLDEDEMQRFLSNSNENCPYYQNGDEYQVVKHQAF